MALTKAKKVTLSREYYYEGKKYGPGEVEIRDSRVIFDTMTGDKKTIHVADLIKEKDDRIVERERVKSEAAEKARRETEERELAAQGTPGMVTVSVAELEKMIDNAVKQRMAEVSESDEDDEDEDDDTDTDSDDESDDENDDEDDEDESADSDKDSKGKASEAPKTGSTTVKAPGK